MSCSDRYYSPECRCPRCSARTEAQNYFNLKVSDRVKESMNAFNHMINSSHPTNCSCSKCHTQNMLNLAKKVIVLNKDGTISDDQTTSRVIVAAPGDEILPLLRVNDSEEYPPSKKRQCSPPGVDL